MKLKGEMSMLNVLHLEDIDVAAICSELQSKKDEAPQFFIQSPIVVDCEGVDDQIKNLDFSALKKGIEEVGFIPVGVRNIPESMSISITKQGWAVMREHKASNSKENIKEQTQTQADVANCKKDVAEVLAHPVPVAEIKSVTVSRPVRSGQQVYAAQSDMTVLAPTSAGSEVMADGSIHIYGPLRGRVLAGARGNEDARIFCQSLQAELIAIAGRYQLLDELDTKLIGKPAMIRLDGEKLIIEPLLA
jgi:septum site-determining protein MinC